MRIAYLGCKGLPSKSGTERVVEGIVQHLVGKHEITVYCDSRYTPKDTQFDGVRLIRIFTIKGKYTQATSLFFFSAIHALCSQYDGIHLNGVESSFILPLLRLKYRVVTTAHATPFLHPRLKWGKMATFLMCLMEYPFVYLSNCATSVSSPDADYLRNRYKTTNIVYIPNGVDDCIKFDLEQARSRLLEAGLEPGNFLMFAAGRIDPTKGCHFLLEALRQIKNPPKLLVVGDLNQVPSYTDHLRDLAKGMEVVFMPAISDRELLFGLVKQARLFIFPSTNEGMSMMLLEAATLQVPIICSDIAENSIAVQDNVLYFHSADVNDLAEQLRWAIDHPDEMSDLGRKACACVKESLTWEKIAEQYDEIYRTCIV